MATKKKASAKKGAAKKIADASDSVGGISAALVALARSVDDSGLGYLIHLDTISDHAGELASSLDAVAMALAASVIAQHGSAEDRAAAVKHLKSWFWKSEAFSE